MWPRWSLCVAFVFCYLFQFLLPQKLDAQSDAVKVDSLTYQLYEQQRWEELIGEGKKAIKNGYDYYYMQMRVGIAYYETKNYRNATKYFENAYGQYSFSQLTIEYLYYSYLLSGRYFDAGRIVKELTPENRKRLGIEDPAIVEEVYFEAGLGSSGIDKVTKGSRRNNPNDTIYNASIYYDNMKYFQGGIKFKIHPSISTYQGYSYLTLAATEQIKYMNNPAQGFDSKPYQHEYYGNSDIAFARGLKLTPAWHFIWVDFTVQDIHYDDAAGLIIDTLSVSISDESYSLSLRQDFSLFAIEANGVYSKFDDFENNQLGLSVFTYPFGNLSFYTQTGIHQLSNDKGNELIFHQMLGVQLLTNVWLEAEATIGNLRDFTEKNGFVLYNIPEDTRYKIEANILVNLNKHIDLSLRYRLMRRVNNYITFTDFENIQTIETDYNFNTLFGGLTWRF